MTENPVYLRGLAIVITDNQRAVFSLMLNGFIHTRITQPVVILIGNSAVLIIVVGLCVSAVRRIGYAVAVGISAAAFQ